MKKIILFFFILSANLYAQFEIKEYADKDYTPIYWMLHCDQDKIFIGDGAYCLMQVMRDCLQGINYTLCARKQNETVGFVNYYFKDKGQDPLECKNNKKAFIRFLVVHRDHRRQKIGRRLVGAVMAHCKEKGYTQIELHAGKKNEEAIAFYESNGFVSDDIGGLHRRYTSSVKS